MNKSFGYLEQLNRGIVSCRRCPRLVEFREQIAKEKRKQFMGWNYWGKAVPGFGDPNARLLLVGLAPASHGGNRTGRAFTGDKSAEFLIKCLYDVGLANQPNSDSVDDGLQLRHSYITPVLKCVPPGDKPHPEELESCFSYFKEEMALLSSLRCIMALGRIAFQGCLKYLKTQFDLKSKDFPFGHGKFYRLDNGMVLVGCYHPSPRNVNTGRLNHSRMVRLLTAVKEVARIS